MEQEIVKEVLHNSSDISLWGLFLQADIVVKIVMFVLLLASIWCWTIIIEKVFSARTELKKADEFENRFWSGGALDDIYSEIAEDTNNNGSISKVFVAAMKEWHRSNEKGLLIKMANLSPEN